MRFASPIRTKFSGLLGRNDKIVFFLNYIQRVKNNYCKLTLTPGVHDTRFEITFVNNALGFDENLNNNFVIVQNNSNQLLSIANPNLLNLKIGHLIRYYWKTYF